MHSLLLPVLILTVLALQIGWHCKAIRSDFVARGLRVDRIRWKPIERFFGPWSRRQMLYRVWYADRSGEALTCLAVVTIFQGFTIEENRTVATVPTNDRRATQTAGPRIMKYQDLPWLAVVASAVSCFAIGVQYWSVPYREAELPGSLIGPGLLILAASTAALQFREPRRWRSTLVIMALAPIAAVCVRIASDVARDPTSHNLFPFELAIAGLVSAVVVGVSMTVGGALRRITTSAGVS